MKDKEEHAGWSPVTVTSVEPIGEGLRVCLDLVDFLAEDEGVLTGSTGHGYVLALAETRESAAYPPRPFRVNCGAVHQYVRQGERTIYLSEIRPGMPLIVNSPRGERQVAVGRVKMERRPLLRIVAQRDDEEVSVVMQASESVHLWGGEAQAKPVLELAAGDQLLYWADQPGRHLGERTVGEIIEL
ncbi:3-dehydroquinate synthase II [Paenibacillus sp. 1P07SE]|uniref:3-dehydroquinate synthase II n=1 Tax=Paenibacillus sp. 1P07SE TaxID=3132209 RepID=UPI0039A442AC